MQVKCPSCGFSGNIADKLVPDEGRTVKCPKCKNGFFITKEKPPTDITDHPLGMVNVENEPPSNLQTPKTESVILPPSSKVQRIAKKHPSRGKRIGIIVASALAGIVLIPVMGSYLYTHSEGIIKWRFEKIIEEHIKTVRVKHNIVDKNYSARKDLTKDNASERVISAVDVLEMKKADGSATINDYDAAIAELKKKEKQTTLDLISKAIEIIGTKKYGNPETISYDDPFVNDYSFKTDLQKNGFVVEGWTKTRFIDDLTYQFNIDKTDSVISPYIAYYTYDVNMCISDFYGSKTEAANSTDCRWIHVIKNELIYSYQDNNWVFKSQKN